MSQIIDVPESHVYDLDFIRRKAKKVFREMFEDVCESIQQLDGKAFTEHFWTRDKSGILMSTDNKDDYTYVDRSFLNGKVFEKVGVNYVAIEGELPPGMTFQKSGALVTGEADSMSSDVRTPYFATGASFVIHPYNPMVPIAHVNYRYFQVGNAAQPAYWWFGGGADLTPSYLFEEDAVHFHKVHKEVCDKYNPSYYARFKKWCDDYFFIKHRAETRGIGGIFFDHLNNSNPQEILAFVTDCTKAFARAYMPIVERRKDMSFTEENKYWQRLVRGRYVEFILTSDRGMRFGLESGMVSQQSVFNCMPPEASWKYDDQPSVGSKEAMLKQVLKNAQDWV
jgi:coproporphyrinogen III oxidase